jgi:hypothetical protein
MTELSSFQVLRVHRVGSCVAIAELEYVAHQIQSGLDSNALAVSGLNAVLDRFPRRENGFAEHTVAARQVKASDLERQLQAVHEEIKAVLALGPIKGTESIPWNNPDVRLKSLEELFPEYCGDK